jgi:DNA replication protein DnaC
VPYFGYNAVVSHETCPKCQGTGWFRIERDGTAGVVRCDCLKDSRLGRLLRRASIPQRYEHCELDNFDIMPSRQPDRSIEMAKMAAEKFVQEYPLPQPFGLLFMGPQGIGKTHLAVGIIKQLIGRKSVPCLFCTFPELLKEIQNSYNPISQASELSLLAPVLDTEVLVLDELGAQKPSDWVRDTVAYVLNYRYNENKVTIITTNYIDREDGRVGITDSLTQRITERIRSRLFEMCKTIPMNGVDYRKEIKHAKHYF